MMNRYILDILFSYSVWIQPSLIWMRSFPHKCMSHHTNYMAQSAIYMARSTIYILIVEGISSQTFSGVLFFSLLWVLVKQWVGREGKSCTAGGQEISKAKFRLTYYLCQFCSLTPVERLLRHCQQKLVHIHHTNNGVSTYETRRYSRQSIAK